jgi:hypothetical protein
VAAKSWYGQTVSARQGKYRTGTAVSNWTETGENSGLGVKGFARTTEILLTQDHRPMDTAKGLKFVSLHGRPSRHVLFSTVSHPAQAFRRLRCWAICPVADELELEDWMAAGQVDG